MFLQNRSSLKNKMDSQEQNSNELNFDIENFSYDVNELFSQFDFNIDQKKIEEIQIVNQKLLAENQNLIDEKQTLLFEKQTLLVENQLLFEKNQKLSEENQKLKNQNENLLFENNSFSSKEKDYISNELKMSILTNFNFESKSSSSSPKPSDKIDSLKMSKNKLHDKEHEKDEKIKELSETIQKEFHIPAEFLEKFVNFHINSFLMDPDSFYFSCWQ